MKKLLHLRLYCSWSILLHTVSGASRSLFIFLSGFSILGSGLSNAQTQDELNAALQLQAKPLFQQLATGEKIFRWTGQSGFSYFIQASPNLLDWDLGSQHRIRDRRPHELRSRWPHRRWLLPPHPH